MGAEDAVPASRVKSATKSSDGESEVIMKMRQVLCRIGVCVTLLAAAGSSAVMAQNTAVRSRVVEAVDDTVTVKLQGNVHPLARAQYDQGAVPDSQPITHMLLLLQRSADQELALRQLLDAQMTKGSASYHAWLTPDQFGKQFGPSDSDVQAVTDWLTKQGFQIRKVYAGKTVIEFDGIAAQVRNAFHTEIHKYVVNGGEHFANASDPQIPEALSPVVRGVAALHNFPKHSYAKVVGNFRRDAASGRIKPLFSYTDATGSAFAVGPKDFATIYGIPNWPNYGASTPLAIVGQSNVNPDDITSFQTMFGLPANFTSANNVILNGPDPGVIGPNTIGPDGTFPDDEIEADLDIQTATSIAPQAQILFVVSQTTTVSAAAGIDLSALYIIDNNIAPIMSESYGDCEADLGTAGNAFYNLLWQQASAQGISVVIAAGDTGSAACDTTTTAAEDGIAISGLASTPYNVAMGGTDFNQDATTIPNYWSSTNGTPYLNSALGYIPETVWNDSTCAANFLLTPTPSPCTSVDSSGLDISAGGGGPSNCVTTNSSGNCITNNGSFPNGGYPKPAFQTTLTPADKVRDIPDISLFAGNGFNGSFYVVCQSDATLSGTCSTSNITSTTPGDQYFLGVGGTSGATPAFAAIMTGIVAQHGRQGNPNYVLYLLGAKQNYAACNSSSFSPSNPPPASCVFNDVTLGTNAVACVGSTTDCTNTSSTGFGVLQSPTSYSATAPTSNGYGVGVNEGNPAFTAVQGYDLATGLGSINVSNLLTNWTSVSRTATTTTLTGGSSNVSGSNYTFTITVSPTPANGESVALNALASDQKTILASIGATSSSGSTTTNSNQLVLTNGSTGNVTTNLLPPGTAFLQAMYGGDAGLAMSTSTNLAVAVSPQSNTTSKTTLNFVTFNSNTGAPVLNTGSISVTYGSPYILEIVVTNNGNQQCSVTSVPCPIGNIALTDNGTALNDWPNAQTANATNIAKLNNQGLAEDQAIQLAVGSHPLQATFTPGTTPQAANYTGSTSNTVNVTITQASTSLLLGSNATTITSGTSVTFTAYIVTSSSGAGPTGSVAFTSNGASIGSATCTPTSGLADVNPPISQLTVGEAFCTATLTASISSLYPPSVGTPRTPTIPRVPVILALVSLLLFVLGLRWVPQARRRAYSYAGLLVIALLVGVVAGCGGGGGGSSGGSTRNIKASYPGDTNYTSSNSSLSIVVTQ